MKRLYYHKDSYTILFYIILSKGINMHTGVTEKNLNFIPVRRKRFLFFILQITYPVYIIIVTQAGACVNFISEE